MSKESVSPGPVNIPPAEDILSPDAIPAPEHGARLLHQGLEKFRDIRDKLTEALGTSELSSPVDSVDPVESGRERLRGVLGRSAEMAKEATRISRETAKERLIVARGDARERVETLKTAAKPRLTAALGKGKASKKELTSYIASHEKETKRVIVAGAIGTTAIAAAYSIHKARQNKQAQVPLKGEQTSHQKTEATSKPDNKLSQEHSAPKEPAIQPPWFSEESAEDRLRDSVGEHNILDKYADQVDFKHPTMDQLMDLGYGFYTAAVIHELITGHEGVKVNNAQELRTYAKAERERDKSLAKHLDRLYKPNQAGENNAEQDQEEETTSPQSRIRTRKPGRAAPRRLIGGSRVRESQNNPQPKRRVRGEVEYQSYPKALKQASAVALENVRREEEKRQQANSPTTAKEKLLHELGMFGFTAKEQTKTFGRAFKNRKIVQQSNRRPSTRPGARANS